MADDITRLLDALGAYGGGEKLMSCKKEFPFFESAVVAFFNQLPVDVVAGRKAVKVKFGPQAIRKVTRMMKTGCMEVFQHDETPEALCYVMAVARSAEARAREPVGAPASRLPPTAYAGKDGRP